MRSITHPIFYSVLNLALVQATAAFATDEDALNLVGAPTASAEGPKDTKIFFEAALGSASQRYSTGDRSIGRVSLDFSHTAKLGSGLRAVISNRIDHFNPREFGVDSTVNSLREAYVSWQPDDGKTVVEFGRINLRYGPGYGYNPTDFFRDGSLRALTTADPFALRENRLGTVMLRAQRLWANGSLSVSFAPKLADRPNPDGWSLDLGSTNNRDRALIALSTQFSTSVSSQVLLYEQQGLSPTLGASLTALLSDAAVAHMEFSRGNDPDLLSQALALTPNPVTRNRLVAGVTYTTLGKLSITGEYQYNGFALSQTGWAALGAAPRAPGSQLAYLREALRLQELAPRQAYLIYVTQKSLGVKDLDLTAYLRLNPGDDSGLAWVELRHHWPSFDLSFQLQQNFGRPNSEFGVSPDRQIIQVLGTYYF